MIFSLSSNLSAVYRNGTTSLSFLEIDIASSRVAMGGAGVSLVSDASSTFWNPAGLTFVKDTETSFMYQPYWDDTSIIFMGIASSLNNSSYIGAGFLLFNWGDIEQTDLIYQDGTGVIFNPSEYSFSLSFFFAISNTAGYTLSFEQIISKLYLAL